MSLKHIPDCCFGLLLAFHACVDVQDVSKDSLRPGMSSKQVVPFVLCSTTLARGRKGRPLRSMQTERHICMYVCMYVCLDVFMCIYIYTLLQCGCVEDDIDIYI